MLQKNKAKVAIKNAINVVADAVEETFGVYGKTAVIPTPFNHIVTKDGVSVVSAIELEDVYENIIVGILKDSALRTNKAVGDGSTTFTILVRALYNTASKHIENGAKPIDVKRGMDLAVEAVLSELDNLSTKISSPEELKSIATISANNDEFLGGLIGEVFDKIGVEGVTTIEPSTTGKTYTDIIQGMSFDKGWYGPIFANNKVKMVAEYENVGVIICDYAITDITELIPILNWNHAENGNKPILLICDDIDYNTQSTLVDNMSHAGLKIVITRAPYFGVKRYTFLEDLAIYTEAKLFSKDNNTTLENFTPSDLGTSDKIISSKDSTIIIRNNDNPLLEERAKGIDGEEDYDKARLANLRGKLGVIYIGADTDVEYREKYDRVEDALNATKSSLEEGYILGGGNALLKISKTLKLSSKNEDEQLGVNSVLKAITTPFKSILKNADQEYQHAITLVDKSKDKGYSVKDKRIKNLIDLGIIDPVKVTKYALRNANSVATQLLTTNVIIK